jgi:hypothetical protein
MCNATEPAEYIDGKASSPDSILKELGEYISFHCTHGAKKPISHRNSEQFEPAVYCCLKCAVDFIWRQRANSKIINRTGT